MACLRFARAVCQSPDASMGSPSSRQDIIASARTILHVISWQAVESGIRLSTGWRRCAYTRITVQLLGD
ncbi:unnamed protein product [Zymoseptoria tritici ST99CH_3D7]|uniref:Uncharacterized protein n=1 Tax=Zymoseptoria tritici (strain ST99CH_3D7) TaxID=1276538 RepID=A0A1X7RP54_ZYMT9|nr:unnamed protein product [Zymoseptoria tritici ST99CH_3D7]